MPTLIPIRLIPKSERHLVPLSNRPSEKPVQAKPAASPKRPRQK